MVVAEMTSAIVLGDATVNDATETEAIIAALASQYNTTTVQDAGAEVPCTPSRTPSPQQSHHIALFTLR